MESRTQRDSTRTTVFIILVPVFYFCLVGFFLMKEIEIDHHEAKTTATIDATTPNLRTVGYFYAVNGVTHRGSASGKDLPVSTTIGSKIEVLYSTKNPSISILKYTLHNPLQYLIVTTVLMFLILPFCAELSKRSDSRKTRPKPQTP